MKSLTTVAQRVSEDADTVSAKSPAFRLTSGLKTVAARLGVTARLRLALFALLAPPPALALYLLESGSNVNVNHLAALWLAMTLVLFRPLSGWIGRWVVLGEIDSLHGFCAALRRGDYSRRFALPPQAEDEHELIVLKRDLNWMAHHFETREMWLQARLDETHERKRLFENLSRTDALTGLYNRRHFDMVLADQTRLALARGSRLALLLIDCDDFKSINDMHGHPAGDSVLAGLGKVLRESVREGVDKAFRLGGDEFALVLPGLDGQTALRVAKRIRLGHLAENAHGSTVSVGVAAFEPALDATCSARSLVARCDAALYRVKSCGGDGESLAEALSAMPREAGT